MKRAACTLMLAMSSAFAQTSAPPSQYPIHTYPLHYATTQADQNELLTAVRNMISPSVRIFLVPSLSQILVSGPPEDNARVQQILQTLDVPAPLYRLTYIFTEIEGGKRIGTQQYSTMLVPNQRGQLKEGDRVPIITGSIGANPENKQTTYIDIGFNFESTIAPYGADAVRLSSRVERSSLSEEKATVAMQDPVIRQTFINGISTLTLGKPQHLGNIDVIGSTRQLQIDALVEVAK